MIFLKWLGGLLVLFWLMTIIFKIGGNLVNLFLLLAVIIFTIDILVENKKYSS
ncbi:DUF5670 family protein [Clostridium rectalis]|uniref:DUF5670 family protein n=1 Tax=Clostridium rectalis TaxID=2040295 RepID=UPI0013DDA132|nr:DUF5670 family protein [Clostridium rectalis]